MNNMHLMIDIETLGRRNKAPVVSIGAVLFDKEGIKKEFEIVFDLYDQIDKGVRIVDYSTIKFWINQGEAAKKIFRDNGVATEPGLRQFCKWIKQNCDPKTVRVWGNGFDIPIMESMFNDYGVALPWHYRNIRDLRTFKEYVLQGVEVPQPAGFVLHDALWDAKFQAQVVIEGLRILSGQN